MIEFKAIGPYVRIWSADEQGAQQRLESIKRELSDKFDLQSPEARRIVNDAYTDMVERYRSALATKLKRTHCAEAEANPMPPTDSEGEE